MATQGGSSGSMGGSSSGMSGTATSARGTSGATSGGRGQGGTSDPTYDLISVMYHALQGCETYEKYAQDAEQGGQRELAQFFREATQESQRRAERGRQLLVQCLQQEGRGGGQMLQQGGGSQGQYGGTGSSAGGATSGSSSSGTGSGGMSGSGSSGSTGGRSR